MENFEGAPRKVKEKNVFLLHLDTPRIIILSSAVIGVITVAFLLGMNFMTKKKVSDNGFTKSNAIFNENKTFSLNKGSSTLTEDDKKTQKDDKISIEKDDITTKDSITGSIDNKKNDKMITTKDDVDDLNNDNINTIYEGKKKRSQNISKKKRSVASLKKRSTRKKKTRRITKKRKYRKKRIVEVSYSSKKLRPKRYGYSIQVASYDNKRTANRELRRLKRKSFDAYIYSTRVDGKRFYRVRIGPLTSKSRALTLLRKVQRNSRYKASYMVKR